MELRAEGISKRYLRNLKDTNMFPAVKETSLTLAEGELLAVAGRSGSGKSTLLTMLAGLLEPAAGKVLLTDNSLGETDLYALSDDRRSRIRNRFFGIIPQGQSGISSLTVRENILLPTLLYTPDAGEAQLSALAERLDIIRILDAYPRELSGGEMRRMAIARALILSPHIVFADEPTGDLDDENTREVLKLLRETADRGTSVFLVTHEEEAGNYADRVMYMKDGVLMEK